MENRVLNSTSTLLANNDDDDGISMTNSTRHTTIMNRSSEPKPSQITATWKLQMNGANGKACNSVRRWAREREFVIYIQKFFHIPLPSNQSIWFSIPTPAEVFHIGGRWFVSFVLLAIELIESIFATVNDDRRLRLRASNEMRNFHLKRTLKHALLLFFLVRTRSRCSSSTINSFAVINFQIPRKNNIYLRPTVAESRLRISGNFGNLNYLNLEPFETFDW